MKTNKIILDDTYFIEVDELNWALKKLVPVAATKKDGTPAKNAGKKKEVCAGYCHSLKQALEFYADRRAMDDVLEAVEPVNLRDLKLILETIESDCNALQIGFVDEREAHDETRS